MIKSIFDIYYLKDHKSKILQIPKFGLKKFNNMIESIENSRKPKLSNYIYALGIPNVGIVTAKHLSEYFKTHIDFVYCKKSDLLKIEDIGETTANSILHYLKTNGELILNLMQELDVLDDAPKETTNAKDNPLKGKHIYPTGKFTLNKTDLKLQLEKVGAIVETGYKKSLDYLIVANDSSKSGKADKAKNDNVKIMSEDEMNEIFKESIQV